MARDPKTERERAVSTDPVTPERRRATTEPDTPGPGRYAAGDVIDSKYRLSSLIGQGGMGAVWLAHNLALDADVCVKLIRRESATPGAPLRLLQEARAVARLNHPSIVRVFDFGETQHGDPFIVMELLRGESLRRLMERKNRLPATTAVATMLPVASALAEAHAKQIVHRDLKPENVLLESDENGAVVPKVVDFGVAKVQSDGMARGLTAENVLVGSPDYMSPEQAQGRKDIDERADVWAFSAVLYELIVGHVPFRGENYNALLWAIQHEPPEPATAHLSGDAELWAILGRGLEKRREDRWPSMRELGTALAHWAVAHEVEVDVTGGAIAIEWLSAPRRPLSEAPSSSLRAASPAGKGVPHISRDRLATPDAADCAPFRASRPRGRGALLAATVVVVVGGAALALYTEPRWRVFVTPRPARVATSESLATTLASPAGSGESVPSAATVVPSGLAPAGSSGASDASPSACLTSLFQPGTFGDATALRVGFLCRERDPRRGALELEEVVVKNRGSGVSGGMREWSNLNWYEMAAFAVARTRCCPDAEPLVLPANGGICPPTERVLSDLGVAVSGPGDAKPAIDAFDQNVLCLMRNGGTAPYPYAHLAKLGQLRAVFEQIVARAKKASAGSKR